MYRTLDIPNDYECEGCGETAEESGIELEVCGDCEFTGCSNCVEQHQDDECLGKEEEE